MAKKNLQPTDLLRYSTTLVELSAELVENERQHIVIKKKIDDVLNIISGKPAVPPIIVAETTGETYDVPGSNEIITGDKEPIGRACQNTSCAKFDGSVYGNCTEPEEMAGCIDYLADVPGTVPRPADCDEIDCMYGDQCPTTCSRVAK